MAFTQSTPKRTGSSRPSHSILTSSHAHRISIEGRPAGHLSQSPEQLGHLLGGMLRSSGMPQKGYADPITNGGPRFHLNKPVSELTEHVTRAIEASDVSSTSLVAETVDGVMHKTRPTTQVAVRNGHREYPDQERHKSPQPQKRVPRYSAFD